MVFVFKVYGLFDEFLQFSFAFFVFVFVFSGFVLCPFRFYVNSGCVRVMIFVFFCQPVFALWVLYTVPTSVCVCVCVDSGGKSLF